MTDNTITTDAPYNFVPLASGAVAPEWANAVSQDVPFEDGVSGVLHYQIEACSPLLVGGHVEESTRDQVGQVHFVKQGNRYVLPGSSLRGLLRNVVEIATLSRFKDVDDQRFGLRDVSSKSIREAYAGALNSGSGVCAGFLRRGDDGLPRLIPCQFARWDHDMAAAQYSFSLRDESDFFGRGASVSGRYSIVESETWSDRFGSVDQVRFVLDPNSTTEVQNMGANLPDDAKDGYLVLTGQVSDSWAEQEINVEDGDNWMKRTGKHHDYIFFDEIENESLAIHEKDSKAWGDFLFIHSDDVDSEEDGAEDMSWPGFWRERYHRGEKVPVFYVGNQKELSRCTRLRIGLAKMPKIAGDLSVHDLVNLSSRKHLDESHLDYAALIFGQVSARGQTEHSLKGRVSVGPALLRGERDTTKSDATVLGSPKASYFPHYLEQDCVDNSRTYKYKTYLKNPEERLASTRVRGWKRYPVRPDDKVKITPVQRGITRRVQTHLNTLPTGCEFDGRIVFHNLRPQEFGALLWALDFGGKSTARHSLGMGKSFGLGQIKVSIDENQSFFERNDTLESSNDITTEQRNEFIEAFINDMNTRLEGCKFDELPQVRSLVRMADLESHGNYYRGRLQHMQLDVSGRNNPFSSIKAQNRRLKGFLSAVESKAAILNSHAPWKLPPEPEEPADKGGDGAGLSPESQALVDFDAMVLAVESGENTNEESKKKLSETRTSLLKLALDSDDIEFRAATRAAVEASLKVLRITSKRPKKRMAEKLEKLAKD